MSENRYIGRGGRDVSGYSFVAVLAFLLIVCALAVAAGLMSGTVQTSLKQVLGAFAGDEGLEAFVVRDIRLPRLIAAIAAGGVLAVCGLLMQTYFANGLAGPHVLGVNAGAMLGAATVILGVPGMDGTFAKFGAMLGAIAGAGLVFFLLMVVARRVQSAATILILGLIFGQAVGGLVSVLVQFTTPDRVQAFMVWQNGTFGSVPREQLLLFLLPLGLGTGLVMLLVRGLDGLQLGELYAQSVGIRTQRYRYAVIGATALMSGVVTAFCGPIAFLGVATPHFVRPLLASNHHRHLIPTVFVAGATLAVLADLVSNVPGSEYKLPLNAITAVIGAPVIAWVVLRK